MLPKYVKTLARNLKLTDHPCGEPGYTWKLWGKYQYGQNTTLVADAEKIIAWAKRNYAESKIIEVSYGRNRNERKNGRNRDYVILTITDPVSLWLENYKTQSASAVR